MPAPATDNSFPAPVVENGGGTQRAIGWTVAVIGAAGVGVGAGFGLASLSKRNESREHCSDLGCDNDGLGLRDDAVRNGNISTIRRSPVARRSSAVSSSCSLHRATARATSAKARARFARFRPPLSVVQASTSKGLSDVAHVEGARSITASVLAFAFLGCNSILDNEPGVPLASDEAGTLPQPGNTSEPTPVDPPGTQDKDAGTLPDQKPSPDCATGQMKCFGSCVSMTDPLYGCGNPSCTPCASTHSTMALRRQQVRGEGLRPGLLGLQREER